MYDCQVELSGREWAKSMHLDGSNVMIIMCDHIGKVGER
jgi:hypothetical protein